MVLKRIYGYLFILGLSLIIAACASMNPLRLTSVTQAVSQEDQGAATAPVLTPEAPNAQKTAVGTPSKTPVLTPTEVLASQTPSMQTWETALPTSDLSGFPDVWSTYYSDPLYPFSFEYPSLYDSEAYSRCKITREDNANYVLYLRFGYRSELAITKNDLHSLDAYVERWMQGMDIESENDQTINGLQGITIDYRFGGTNRFGSSTFISQDDLIYIFNFTAGAFCNLNEINLDEYTIYKHAIETFKPIDTNPW
jgi:hypothetical protein